MCSLASLYSPWATLPNPTAPEVCPHDEGQSYQTHRSQTSGEWTLVRDTSLYKVFQILKRCLCYKLCLLCCNTQDNLPFYGYHKTKGYILDILYLQHFFENITTIKNDFRIPFCCNASTFCFMIQLAFPSRSSQLYT